MNVLCAHYRLIIASFVMGAVIMWAVLRPCDCYAPKFTNRIEVLP